MKRSSILKIALGLSLSAACIFGVVGCSTETEENTTEALQVDTGLTGGVAATVNGVEIEEDKVTRYINNMRINGGYETDEDWKKYLEDNNYTVESLRDEVIDSLVDQELVIQCADQRGVTATDEEIDSYVQEMRGNYSSDEAWQTALEGAGFENEDGYREALQYSILNKKLDEGFEAESEPTEEELVAEVQSSITTYDGAKRSSHILFAKEDKEKAEEVLNQIRNGEIAFADAATQYSTDTGSAENGGDVGWDKLTTFVTEYQDAVTNLNVGDVSDLVESEYGYHIITVTEEFNAPETIESTDQVPDEILEEIKTNITSTSSDEAKDAWLKSMRETNDVVINPMPDGLPYWVQLDEPEEEQAQTNEEAAENLADDVAAEEAALSLGDAAAADGSTDGAAADTGSADAAGATGTEGAAGTTAGTEGAATN